ncbi:MAG: serine/threonine protein kinase [Streptosporangiaceae bacterium]|nr:serine/threonine protein kinase [Streptosporangiaceae bacterium]
MKGVNTSGDRVGHYRLLEILGEGGMGVVHLAADQQGRKVAIKVLRPQVAGDATALRRLAREVDTMRRVHSPHVAEILDADVTAERPYIVTQYVPGRTLEESVFDGGPMSGRPLQRLATGLASALASIHGAGVIHRDLKPGNVMILDGEPVLIDFGIAQGMDATRLTATGLVIGTPGYLAPEIIEGEDAGTPADVHSWAATLVYAATGRPPFGSGTFESIFYKIMQGTPDLDGVPEAMLPLIRSAMAHHPAERPTAVTLVQLARRIDLDATMTDQTRVDTPFQVFTPPPPEPARTPPPQRPPQRPLQQPKDFKGLLPPAAPPPAPPPAPAPQPRRQRTAQPAQPPPYAPVPPAQQPYPPYNQPQQPRRGAARHQPDPSPAGAGAGQAGQADETSRRKPYGLYRLCSLAALACVLGFAAILPTLTLMFVVVLVLVLRAGDRAAKRLESKRTRRGKSGGDVIGAVVKAPLALPRALMTTLLLTPLGLFAGVVLVLVLMVVYPDMTVVRAATYGSMAVIGLHFLGPGSVGPRRQAARMWATFLPRREPAAIIALSLAVFAVVLFGLSAGKTPDLQPLSFSGDTKTLNGLKTDIQSWIGIGN